MTALTEYLQEVNASSTLSTANQLIENGTTTSSNTNKNSNVNAGTTGWVEVYSQGNGTAVNGAGSEFSPTGHGWFDDGTTLEGQHFASGTWTATIRMSLAAGSCTADLHLRAYQYHSGTYTLIAEMAATGQSLTTTQANYTLTASSVAASNTFATGDKLYFDLPVNITASSSGGNLKLQESSSGTQGYTSAQVVTPGYLASTQVDKDIAIRGRISAQVDKDIAVRGRIQQIVTNDIKLRGNVGFVARKDIAIRGRIQQLIKKDIAVRGRISQRITKDIAIRGKTANTVAKDIVIRGRVTGPPITSGGIVLAANVASGTVSFDHLRATQYPDPSLSLSQVLPRVGSTSASWDDTTPTGSSAAFAISTDALTWTDVTGSNGGALPQFFSQPQPTIDGFDSNTSANYTSTNRTGGAVATVTYDTANSRITMTGGTNALYIYNAISRADIDLIADMDQSDAGGMVWRYTDPSNFYYATIADGSASVGTPNTVTLYRVASNVQTQLASASISLARGTPSRFRVTMLSNVITIALSGTTLITSTDASPLSSAGKVGLYNNDGAVGSRYYQLIVTPQGDYVSGTPQGDIVTGTFVYTKETLTVTDPSVMPQIADMTVVARNPEIMDGATIPQLHDPSKPFAEYYHKEMDTLKQASGDWWWNINNSRHLIFQQRYGIPAPWIIYSADPLLMFKPSVTPLNCSDLYRNRQTITNCTGLVTQSEQKIADGTATSWTLAYPLYSAPVITVQSVAQTVGIKGVDTGKNFYWQAGNNTITQDASAAKIPDGYVIAIPGYTGQYTKSVTVDNLAEQAAMAEIDGTTGIVEAWEDGQGMLESAAITYANGLLTRFGNRNAVEVSATYKTLVSVVEGMSVPCFIPEHHIQDAQLLVTKVTTTAEQQADGNVLYFSTIDATNGPNLGNWATPLF